MPSLSPTALDELIAAKPKRGRPAKRGRGGRANGSAKAAALGTKAGNAVAAAAATANRNKQPLVIPGRAPGGNQGSKIIVSNLPTDVTEGQVKVNTNMDV